MSEAAEESRRRRRSRRVVRCCALAVSVVLVLPVLPWAWTPMILPSLSPHVLIGSLIAARSITAATWVGLPVLVIVLVRRRWFCRYACPVGLLAEQAGRLRSRASRYSGRVPSVGRWIVLITLGGACFGYPLFLWLDPLAIFNGTFTLWGDPLSLAGRISGIVLGLILAVSLLLPGAWCARICPLGATQELLALPKRLLRATQAPAATASGTGALSRRSVVSMATGALCIGLGARWAEAAWRRSSRNRPTLLRPPGSVEEGRFRGLCVRCGNCVRACPTGIIRPDAGEEGVGGFLTPTISFAEDYCREDCRRCTEVCPSGAIARLSLDEKKNRPIGLAKVDTSLCLLAEDRECDLCARACPFQAVRITWSDEEYIAVPQVDPDKCPGCGACEVLCPGTNDWERRSSDEPIPIRKAIEVHPRATR